MTTNNFYKKGQVHINTGLQKDTYSKLLQSVKFKKDEKVFDAGCANGILGRYLKNVILGGGFKRRRQSKNPRIPLYIQM